MALLAATSGAECLYSTVRNIGLTGKFFGFLPPHGRRLACNEEITVFGEVKDYLQRFTPNERAKRSLEVALAGDATYAKTLVIVNTPSVHLYDATLDVTRILTLDNGSVSLADPCWGEYSSGSLACA